MFFLYTFVASMFTFSGIMYIYIIIGTTDIGILSNYSFTKLEEYLLFICLMFSFWVKVPVIPFHGWLPEAHVEAPTSGSILLAGILLKIATYGMFRFLFPIFPNACLDFSIFIITFNIASMFYAGFIAFRHDDIKKVVAYSSIVHMNFLMAGIFSNEIMG